MGYDLIPKNKDAGFPTGMIFTWPHIDATDREKKRIVDEVERELNITDISHEEIGN